MIKQRPSRISILVVLFALFAVGAGLVMRPSTPQAHANAARTSTGQAATDTLPSADTVFQAWNNAFLVQNGSGSYGSYGTAGTYYTDQLKSIGNQRAGTWIAGLDIAVAEDDYARTHSPADWTLVNNLVTTFLNDDGTNWTSWDGWNDDIGWMTNATLRGYQITGNTSWLHVAETQWNNAYNRGWSSDGGGGIWENDTHYSKCALSNDPFVWEGVSLYQITGDSSYLTKAVQIYKWVKDHLVTSSGQVNGCIAFPNGTGGGTVLQGSDNAYDAGGFIEAGDAIYRATADSGYASDAERTADHFLNNVPIPANNSERGSSYQYWLFKGMADYCTDAGNCAKYAGYMTANAAQAWSERNSANLTWNDWTKPTNDSNPDAFEMNGMVGLFEVLPTTTASYKYIQNRNSGKVLDVTGWSTSSGTTIDQWDKGNGQANQEWSLVSTGDGYYYIQNRNSGKVLDVTGWSTINGATIDQWDKGNGQANQEWSLVSTGDGYYYIQNRNSGKVLDVMGWSTTNGATIDQWDKGNGQANQEWQLINV